VGEGGFRGGSARSIEQAAEKAHEGGPKGCRWDCEESCEQEACGQKIRRRKETRTNEGIAKRLVVVTGSA